MFFLFLGVVCRSAEVCGRFWVGNKRQKNKQKTKHFLIKMREKKGTIQAYFHLSIQSGLVCNGKINLKSDFRTNILNDRYRPIEQYVFKKTKQNKTKQNKTKQKQKQKQKTKTKKQKKHVSVKISD